MFCSAGDVMTSIDSLVSPCEDFYQFACGGWQKQNPPQSTLEWDVSDSVHYKILFNIKSKCSFK